jgi:hypothetical protein
MIRQAFVSRVLMVVLLLSFWTLSAFGQCDYRCQEFIDQVDCVMVGHVGDMTSCTEVQHCIWTQLGGWSCQYECEGTFCYDV